MTKLKGKKKIVHPNEDILCSKEIVLLLAPITIITKNTHIYYMYVNY